MGARILAIDDSAENLTLIELYLHDTEFELSTAMSGAEGLESVRRHDFDLILLDVVMPGMDGFEVCERLKSDPRTREIPVIFLTGEMHTESSKLHAFQIGAVDYLARPVHGDELIARIRVMLRLRAAGARLESENLALARELQQAHSDLKSLEAEATYLRELEDGVERTARMHAWFDADGALRRWDERFATYVESVLGFEVRRLPVLPEIADWLRRPSERDEIWIDVDGVTRCLDVMGVRTPGHRSEYELLSIRDVTRDREIRQAMEARRRVVVPTKPAQPSEVSEYTMTDCIGSSASMREVARVVDRLRNVRSTVLICGESGTGKELVARALHFDGRYKAEPFIAIHCGSISPNIIESELFGHEKGAFTGAEKASRGLFMAADRGTVFLDEISETTPDLQIKLLRVLQFGEVRPVGSTNSQRVDVRFVSATNRELAQCVQDGSFREDLFFRLNCVTIRLPALRERVSDIVPIAEFMIERYARKHERHGPVVLSRAAVECLEDYPWPGNVRELESAIDHAFALGCSDTIQVEDLPHAVQACEPPDLSRTDGRGKPGDEGNVLRGPRASSRRAEVDRSEIRAAIARFGGDKERAAAFLGISRATLYRRLRAVP